MYLLSVLESETYARCQKSLVAQSGFKKSSDAVITHTHGYRVHLKSQAGLRPGMARAIFLPASVSPFSEVRVMSTPVATDP